MAQHTNTSTSIKNGTSGPIEHDLSIEIEICRTTIKTCEKIMRQVRNSETELFYKILEFKREQETRHSNITCKLRSEIRKRKESEESN